MHSPHVKGGQRLNHGEDSRGNRRNDHRQLAMWLKAAKRRNWFKGRWPMLDVAKKPRHMKMGQRHWSLSKVSFSGRWGRH